MGGAGGLRAALGASAEDPRRTVAAFRSLDRALETALGRWRTSDEPIGVLFSGGVDSSLLVWELRSRRDLELYTAGVPGSADPMSARTGAQLLGLPWRSLPIDRRRIGRLADELVPELGGLSSVERSVQLSLALALEVAPRRSLLCGQGIDEMFGGYAHFRPLSVPDRDHRAVADLRRLQEKDWPCTVRVAARLGGRIEAPFLDPRFVEAAMAIDPDLRLRAPPPKALFRRWALARGLPAELAGRAKRAMQYGSGVDRELRRAALRPPPTEES